MQHLPDEETARVRALLSTRLAALTASLPAGPRSDLSRQAFETLILLVRNEAERVRAVIAEAVKDMPHAPRELILRLAYDPSVMVAEPVILVSPLLTNADLLTLVATAPSAGTVVAVARRPGIPEPVSDAIAASANAAAIQALLSNPSAQIREAVLDALITASADHPGWQEPLVRRPVLPKRSARALAEIVQTHLLEVLMARPDLDPGVAARLAERLDAGRAPEMREMSAEAALGEARRLSRAALLTEHALMSAIRRGERSLATALLAVAADVPVQVVQHAASLRNAKARVSLTWAAGFSMLAGGAVQTFLGALAPGEALQAATGGGFPMSADEMRWQAEFAGRQDVTAKV